MFHKRVYKPINPQKYKGDPTKIILRSSWEIKFAVWCDKNPSVLAWQSEETVIPYVSPIDNRYHRYFVDFKIEVRNNNGEVKTYLIEIKPDHQTRPPNKRGKNKISYLNEVATWGVNQAKWKAAERYAQDRGWQFMKLTEHDLFA